METKEFKKITRYDDYTINEFVKGLKQTRDNNEKIKDELDKRAAKVLEESSALNKELPGVDKEKNPEIDEKIKQYEEELSNIKKESEKTEGTLKKWVNEKERIRVELEGKVNKSLLAIQENERKLSENEEKIKQNEEKMATPGFDSNSEEYRAMEKENKELKRKNSYLRGNITRYANKINHLKRTIDDLVNENVIEGMVPPKRIERARTEPGKKINRGKKVSEIMENIPLTNKDEISNKAKENELKTEEAPKVEETKKAEEAKKVEETKKAEEAPKVEETKKVEEVKKTEEAPKVEETKKAEEAKNVEETKKVEETQKATTRKVAEPVVNEEEQAKLMEQLVEQQRLKRQIRIEVDPLKNSVSYYQGVSTKPMSELKYIKYPKNSSKLASKMIKEDKDIMAKLPKTTHQRLSKVSRNGSMDPNIVTLLMSISRGGNTKLLEMYVDALSGKLKEDSDFSVQYNLKDIYKSALKEGNIDEISSIAKKAKGKSKGSVSVEKDSWIGNLKGKIWRVFNNKSLLKLRENNITENSIEQVNSEVEKVMREKGMSEKEVKEWISKNPKEFKNIKEKSFKEGLKSIVYERIAITNVQNNAKEKTTDSREEVTK